MQRRIMKVFLMIIFSVLITAGTASAENSLKTGAKALSFGIIDSGIEVSGRLFVNNDMAVLGGIGFALHDNDESTTDYSLSAGIRKYLAKSDLAPFVGGILMLGTGSRHSVLSNVCAAARLPIRSATWMSSGANILRFGEASRPASRIRRSVWPSLGWFREG